MMEIGSDFWMVDISKNSDISTKKSDGCKFLLSGRTALDYILKDIKEKKEVKIAYLPSYCCHTMIEPFVKNNIQVIFYDVMVSPKGLYLSINKDESFDIIYLMEYFGFANTLIEELIGHFKDKGKLVIEDRTHSYLTKGVDGFESDYIYGSLRKWTGLYTGAFACKKYDRWNILSKSTTNKKYTLLRQEAFEMKQTYMDGNIVQKSYLNIYNMAERILEEDYSGYLMDESSKCTLTSMDKKYMSKKRIDNGQYLLDSLKEISCMTPIWDKIGDNIPLFIPVIVKHGLRDKLRKYLIDRNIFLPVHWGQSDLHIISTEASQIYKDVLSIVCDQRYSVKDMEYIVKTIKEFEAYYGDRNNQSR